MNSSKPEIVVTENTVMKVKNTFIKKRTKIIAVTLFLAGGVLTTAHAFSTPDYKGEISKELEQSKIHMQEAKDLACKNVGELTNDCYKHRKGSCSLMTNAKEDFITNFIDDSTTGCGQSSSSESSSFAASQAIPVVVDPSSDPSNPAFFGDESQSK